jgi:hypothetical protein
VDDNTTFAGIADVIKPKLTYDISHLTETLPIAGVELSLPIYYWAGPLGYMGSADVVVYNEDGQVIPRGPTTWNVHSNGSDTNITNKLVLFSKGLNSAGAPNSKLIIYVNEYVYQTRISSSDAWIDMSSTADNIYAYAQDRLATGTMWRRFLGRSNLNFAWFHKSPRYHLVDPAPTNIIDMFVIIRGYYTAVRRWLEDPQFAKPTPPTSGDLRIAFGHLLDNKMISDTVILHPGNIKLLFGSRAPLPLQAKIKIVKNPSSKITDNQIKTSVVSIIRQFFDVAKWEFGETFYFTELAAAIHMEMPMDISTVVLVPTSPKSEFGNLFQVHAKEDEILLADVGVEQIDVIPSLTSLNMSMGQHTTTIKYVTAAGAAVTTSGVSSDDAYCDRSYCDRTYIITLN